MSGLRARRHVIALDLEGVTYDLALTCTENEAHDVAQAIANSSTIEQVDVIAAPGAGDARLLYSWGRS